MSTPTKANNSRPTAPQPARPKRSLTSPALRDLRKKIIYHDPDQWKADIETGDGDAADA